MTKPASGHRFTTPQYPKSQAERDRLPKRSDESWRVYPTRVTGVRALTRFGACFALKPSRKRPSEVRQLTNQRQL
ncbi:MAG: hypothetical protein HRU17_00340 [Polyangiaceae bacterium]|nr:hypothetical protein [Polyangiaceae bacterium]